jgi:hypothetical protein
MEDKMKVINIELSTTNKSGREVDQSDAQAVAIALARALESLGMGVSASIDVIEVHDSNRVMYKEGRTGEVKAGRCHECNTLYLGMLDYVTCEEDVEMVPVSELADSSILTLRVSDIDSAIERYIKSCHLRIHVDMETLDGGSKQIYSRVELRDRNSNILLDATSEVYR